MNVTKKKQIHSKKFLYWNTLPTKIPDVDTMYPSEIKDWVEKWEDEVWTKNSLEYQTQRLKNIKDIPSIKKIRLDEWEMDRLKEVCDLYTRGFYIASISLCGILVEFMTFKIIERWINKNSIEGLIEHSDKLGRQKGRLETLKEIKAITPREFELLQSIRKTRNNYVHSNIVETKGNQTKIDNKKVLENLIEFLNSHFLSN